MKSQLLDDFIEVIMIGDVDDTVNNHVINDVNDVNDVSNDNTGNIDNDDNDDIGTRVASFYVSLRTIQSSIGRKYLPH